MIKFTNLKWRVEHFFRNVKLRAEAKLHKHQGGFKCACCGALTRFKNPEYSGFVNGRRMILQNSNYKIPFGKSLCPQCLMDKIDDYFDAAEVVTREYDGQKDVHDDGVVWLRECDFMKRVLPCVTGIRGSWQKFDKENKPPPTDLFLIIGAEWWNGFHVSREALRILLTDSGVAKTSVINYMDNKVFYKEGSLALLPQRVTEIK
jgi:hypothetical protein